LRGGAIVIVVLDHIRGNPLRDFMPVSLGFSDMAEVFLFLSGCVCGISYSRRLAERGFWECQRKACWRALQLYAANLLMVALFIGAIRELNERSPDFAMVAGVYRLAGALEAPVVTLPHILRLEFEPMVFAVLPFYMLCLLPSLMVPSRYNHLFVLLLAIAAYGAVQFLPETVALPEPWRTAWFFNPFAWQLVFVFGAVCGSRGVLIPVWRSHRIAAPIVAVVGLDAAFVAITLFGLEQIPFAGKANLEPLRLIHFSCVIALGVQFLPSPDQRLWKSQIFAPLAICGRNSLATYCAGGLISTFGSFVLLREGLSAPVTAVAVVNLAAASMTFIAAWTWQSLKAIVRFWRNA
jgi:hypothetical protein